MSRGAVSPIARERPRIVPVRMPGRAAGRTCPLTICQRVAPRASAAWRSELGTVRSASWVVITMIGRIKQAERQGSRKEARAQRQRLDAERPDEQGQAQDAVDDRRHARQVGDVGLDDPPQPAGRSILLEIDPRGDSHGDSHHGYQAQQPEAADDADPEPGGGRIA